jgi:hypothetical protein
MERSSASSKSVKASTEDAAPCVEESTKSTGTNSWQRSFVNQLFARTVETSYGKNHLDFVISSKSELNFRGLGKQGYQCQGMDLIKTYCCL